MIDAKKSNNNYLFWYNIVNKINFKDFSTVFNNGDMLYFILYELLCGIKYIIYICRIRFYQTILEIWEMRKCGLNFNCSQYEQNIRSLRYDMSGSS